MGMRRADCLPFLERGGRRRKSNLRSSAAFTQHTPSDGQRGRAAGSTPKENIMKKSTCLAGALALGLIVAAAGLGASFVAVSGANAQQNAGSGQTGGSVAFVLESGNAGRFEVQSGRLALERSQHVGVRGYAGQTVKDADEMINRVKSINTANVGASMPDGLNTDQQAQLAQLASLSGPDFDREYMRSQIAVGELLKKTFTDYGANGESPTLRVYAAKAVTGYEAQVLQARAIAGSL
jgi:putative membrane protein